MRWLGVLAALAAVSACSDESTNPILARGVEAVGARVRPGATPEGGSPARPAVLTRADIEASGAAAIRVRLIGSSSPGAVFFGAVENNGVVSFVTPLREIVGLRGSQVVSTRGLGTDLLRSWSSPNDPLARPVPPSDWPEAVERSYEWPGAGARGEIRSYRCRFASGPERTITILGRAHRGVEVRETCTGPAGSFDNIHIVDPGTGFVWHTLQWTGPEQGVVDVAIVEPVT